MIRVKSDTKGITSIKRYYTVGDSQMECEVDSFIIIPGVTLYNGIFSTNGNCLNFVERGQMGNTLLVEFINDGELERFFTQIFRDIKLNQLVDIKN